MKKVTLPIYKSYYILEVEEKPLTDYVEIDIFPVDANDYIYSLVIRYTDTNDYSYHLVYDKMYDKDGNVLFDFTEFDFETQQQYTDISPDYLEAETIQLYNTGYEFCLLIHNSKLYNYTGGEEFRLFCHFVDGDIYFNQGYRGHSLFNNASANENVGYRINSNKVYFGPWALSGGYMTFKYIQVINGNLGCWEYYDTEHTGDCFCWRAFNYITATEFIDLSGLKWNFDYSTVGNMFENVTTDLLIINNVNIGHAADDYELIINSQINNTYVGFIDFTDDKYSDFLYNYTDLGTSGSTTFGIKFDAGDEAARAGFNNWAWNYRGYDIFNFTFDDAPTIEYPEPPGIV